MAPPKRQQVEDMPPVGEAVPLARALLELLPSMGGNALVAHRALRMLAAAGAPSPALPAACCLQCSCTHACRSAGRLLLLLCFVMLCCCALNDLRGHLTHAEPGRLALRRAVVALHAAATEGEVPSGAPGDVAVAQAAQWVANRCGCMPTSSELRGLIVPCLSA